MLQNHVLVSDPGIAKSVVMSVKCDTLNSKKVDIMECHLQKAQDCKHIMGEILIRVCQFVSVYVNIKHKALHLQQDVFSMGFLNKKYISGGKNFTNLFIKLYKPKLKFFLHK